MNGTGHCAGTVGQAQHKGHQIYVPQRMEGWHLSQNRHQPTKADDKFVQLDGSIWMIQGIYVLHTRTNYKSIYNYAHKQNKLSTSIKFPRIITFRVRTPTRVHAMTAP